MASPAARARLVAPNATTLLLKSTMSTAIQTRFLSSTAVRLTNTVNTAGNPGELPRFSLKQLGATRGTRIALALGLLTVGFVEGAAWVKFAPSLFGWNESDTESK
ncbi:hypothetical protein BR93DRAFT_930465 [Coniochaeta sp. PMI_546]|nr:hypothetical protein BR93DRAFT_930465 [Coniochaeta sp. PMI_546]